ncbi:MAG: hypothetical protein GKR94_16435 [Gammaproteobacteria bacterium]|nr:hypothetical protein [Gammaproteobacteria bacterium]
MSEPIGRRVKLVDWLFWRDAARPLEPEHAALAGAGPAANWAGRAGSDTGLDASYRALLIRAAVTGLETIENGKSQDGPANMAGPCS